MPEHPGPALRHRRRLTAGSDNEGPAPRLLARIYLSTRVRQDSSALRVLEAEPGTTVLSVELHERAGVPGRVDALGDADPRPLRV